MIKREELEKLSLERIADADILFNGHRYDGAVYLCGYAVEMWLKASICLTLQWEGYPSTNKEFEKYQSFRTHDLDVLLHLSGIEHVVKDVFISEWTVVCDWYPNVRYNPVNQQTVESASEMIESTKKMVEISC